MNSFYGDTPTVESVGRLAISRDPNDEDRLYRISVDGPSEEVKVAAGRARIDRYTKAGDMPKLERMLTEKGLPGEVRLAARNALNTLQFGTGDHSTVLATYTFRDQTGSAVDDFKTRRVLERIATSVGFFDDAIRTEAGLRVVEHHKSILTRRGELDTVLFAMSLDPEYTEPVRIAAGMKALGKITSGFGSLFISRTVATYEGAPLEVRIAAGRTELETAVRLGSRNLLGTSTVVEIAASKAYPEEVQTDAGINLVDIIASEHVTEEATSKLQAMVDAPEVFPAKVVEHARETIEGIRSDTDAHDALVSSSRNASREAKTEAGLRRIEKLRRDDSEAAIDALQEMATDVFTYGSVIGAAGTALIDKCEEIGDTPRTRAALERLSKPEIGEISEPIATRARNALDTLSLGGKAAHRRSVGAMGTPKPPSARGAGQKLKGKSG